MKTEKIIENGIKYTVKTSKNGYQQWRLNNQLHRELGPAEITVCKSEFWSINGQYHRVDGPAIIWNDGGQEWHYYGQYVDVNSQAEFEQWLKLRVFE